MKSDSNDNILISYFIKSVGQSADRYALVVSNQKFTYKYLGQRAARIAATIVEKETTPHSLAAILAYRSEIAYAGILAILLSGKGYVPLNPKFPVGRTHRMFDLSKCNTLIVGKECVERLETLLPELTAPITIILPDITDPGNLPELFPQHHFVSSDDICKQEHIPKISDISSDAIAYLLFTSGSTGIPKGVPVNNKNVTSYIKYISQRYAVNEDDRFSQVFDMTFDLSVHDMFVCWGCGGCLYCVPEQSTMAPAKFIKDNQLTMWFSVPSVAMFMSKMRMLKPDSFPTLRYSLFCGEPLPATSAIKWQKAAPHSIVENLYGPTEATIAIAHYQWDNNKSPDACINGIVPIGWTFAGQRSCVIDQKKRPVNVGEPGELCLSGSQVTKGYLNNPEKTVSQYIAIPALGKDVWYRTGDLVKEDASGTMYYLGRNDNQVQILGYRIELQEIDAVLREASDSEMAVSVAWPIKGGCAEGVIGIICKDSRVNESYVINYCKKFLPAYVVPRKVYFIDSMPLNVNGKIDRRKLVEMLENGSL